jgi:putative FmdB family regulatory protein
MPIYEYECLECGAHFDKLQRFGAPAPGACPNGHKQVHRLLSQPAIIFKGSGFYVTDNKGNGHRNSGGRRQKSKMAASTSDSTAKTETSSTLS